MRNEKGFSLIEVIVAVAVLAIGILSVSVLQTSSLRLNANARGITEASTFAADELEYRMALDYQHAYLQEGGYTIDSTCCPNHPAVLGGYAINTNIQDNAYNMKDLAVTVSWSNFGSFGAGKSLTLESLKPRLRER